LNRRIEAATIVAIFSSHFARSYGRNQIKHRELIASAITILCVAAAVVIDWHQNPDWRPAV
jgi:hypothetical protein